MTRPIVDVDLWNQINPILGLTKPNRFRYRVRILVTHRAALIGIRLVLERGISAEDVPQKPGCESGMTWRKSQDWQAAGAWQSLHAMLLNKPRRPDLLVKVRFQSNVWAVRSQDA